VAAEIKETFVSTILYAKKGTTARITINRPEAMNAFDLATAREMGRRLEEFDRDPELRVALITGAGDKAF
jgi:enoyl-CoA hydratase/carnithine racemase